MAKKIAEKKLWKIVKEGLEKREYGYMCSNSEARRKKLKEGFLSMGIGGVQADVIGFKDVGRFRQPKLEIIAVEVKPDLPNYRQREIDQAKRASLYAHKCFFAAPREFKSREIEIAVKSGIGLFQIDVENKKLKQVAPPVPMNPEEITVIRLMDRLGYFKCAICDCYWNRAFVPIGYRAKNYFSKKEQSKFYKFICDDCAQKLFKMVSPEIKKRHLEEWKTKRLIREQIQDLKKRCAEEWKIKRLIKRQKALEQRLKEKYAEKWKIQSLIRKQEALERRLKNLEERTSKRDKKADNEIRELKRKLRSI